MDSWTEKRIEKLRKLWSEGLSASTIAARLGAGITRNAVIGKIHRLGLSQRAKAPITSRPRNTKPPRPRAPAPSHAPAAVAGSVALTLAPHTLAPPDRPEEEVVIPLSERVTIMELRDGMCRWPIGDPRTAGFRFCGARAIGSTYCGYHAQVAYTTLEEAKRAAAEWRKAHRRPARAA